jgi:phosphopantothenoylcysteine synthetase/decarboxylase
MSANAAEEFRLPRVLLALTGSVAAVKWEALAAALLSIEPLAPPARAPPDAAPQSASTRGRGCELRVVATRSALHFAALAEGYDAAAHARLRAALPPSPLAAEASARLAGSAGDGGGGGGGGDANESVATFAPLVPLLSDDAEWRAYARVGEDAVLHIELRKWADVLVIAPLSANTLAKLAGGLCDNLLTSVARAWEFERRTDVAGSAAFRPAKPILAAPAMNTAMWRHPLTATHTAALERLGVTLVAPESKRLACGDVGEGAMAAVGEIVDAAVKALREQGWGS